MHTFKSVYLTVQFCSLKFLCYYSPKPIYYLPKSKEYTHYTSVILFYKDDNVVLFTADRILNY